ncbi:hypothetical protein EYC95_08810 [Pseudomonas sp. BGI-2]|nr:hypothetical protein EYC95_08810 [Pseudomonas sp. BGI-2]
MDRTLEFQSLSK